MGAIALLAALQPAQRVDTHSHHKAMHLIRVHVSKRLVRGEKVPNDHTLCTEQIFFGIYNLVRGSMVVIAS